MTVCVTMCATINLAIVCRFAAYISLPVFPGFNSSGVIPPFVNSPTERDGSPYQTDLCTLINNLGTTPERRYILGRFLDYRDALRNLGITSGFQILDGSFTEDCERLRGRPPSDIDLVTYGYLPVSPQNVAAFMAAHPNIFQPPLSKHWFDCDAYFVDMAKSSEFVIEDTFYWYGLFSHQKTTSSWKGMLRIPLMADDQAARELLASFSEAERGA